ncbi:MAG TPA: RluA family pseudouridine synthase [Edaphobacter sp.]|jgi:23S rRNA pseudouridine1911/1915/1917 synthase|nr:RluA family pseudouridine synthase [Edaphobacter sp.]
MPSKNMLPKGQRRRTVKPEYRATRGVEETTPPPIPVIDFDEIDEDTDTNTAASVRTFTADRAAANLRLDQYLAQAIPDISRARVQLLIEAGQVRVDGHPAKPKHKLHGGESIEIEGTPQPAPLHAVPEDIPLEILYEDQHLAVINKPAGMMVHAGAGTAPLGGLDERNSGTLVNALLFHFNKLSDIGGELRPGIVHRLDKQTSGLILVAKDDSTHRKLGEMFAQRQVTKTYIALLHGHLKKDDTTVTLPIARDLIRRTRMTTRRADGRTAVSHFHVLERITSPYGPFTLVEVRIETGRTHQIRVHAQSLGHAVVGDTLYGAPHLIPNLSPNLQLTRNFLHAARLSFTHPQGETQPRKRLDIDAPLPVELESFLKAIRTDLPAIPVE